jgi:hypothetical protein
LIACRWFKQSFEIQVWRKAGIHMPLFLGMRPHAGSQMVTAQSGDPPLRIVSVLSAALTVAAATPALAQGGPMSVGLSTDPALRSLHCASAIFMEKYLIEEEKFASPFDHGALDAAARSWTEDAAGRAGEQPGDFIQGKVFQTVSEQKLNNDAERQAQVKWCLARTPPG